jgi:ribosomal protein L11 methyltransferase
MGCGPVQIAFEPLQDRDWLKDQQKRLPPLPIGRFWLYFDPRFKQQIPPDSVPLFLSDTGAFGSGHHITTHQCLLFLERMRDRRPLKVADIGCGSGILSLAVSNLWKCEQIACDIDPKSVLVARENLRANGAHHVKTAISNGFAHPLLHHQGPYDLILANILTEVVAGLAPDINKLLTPNGMAILSGITSAHCDSVLKAYEPYGFHMVHREDGNDWSTVALCRKI